MVSKWELWTMLSSYPRIMLFSDGLRVWSDDLSLLGCLIDENNCLVRIGADTC
jgi:hypothetical protein